MMAKMHGIDIQSTHALVLDHLRQLQMTPYRPTDGQDARLWHPEHLGKAKAQCDCIFITRALVSDHLRQLQMIAYWLTDGQDAWH